MSFELSKPRNRYSHDMSVVLSVWSGPVSLNFYSYVMGFSTSCSNLFALVAGLVVALYREVAVKEWSTGECGSGRDGTNRIRKKLFYPTCHWEI